MADFASAFEYLRPDEGRYVNDVHDSGGETYMGISRVKWPTWDGWSYIDKLKPNVDKLDTDPDVQASVERFYAKNFWRFDGITNQDLANKIFDECVNMGTGTLVKLLQQACRYITGKDVSIDGQYGPQTEMLVNSADPAALIHELRAQIAVYYCGLNDKNFIRGWMRRATR